MELSYLIENAEYFKFEGTHKTALSYFVVGSKSYSRGVIVLAPGQGDPALKYSEFISDLSVLGYTIYILDHRGQGFSQRLLEDAKKSHVENFQDYINDLHLFLSTVVMPERYSSSVLIGDSMGGAIVSGYLSRYPHKISRCVLVSPMFEINVGAFVPQTLASAFAAIADNSITGQSYAPGEGSEGSSVESSSLERKQMVERLYKKFPELKLGGMTNRWLNQALSICKELKATSTLFNIPTLVIQSGCDVVVNASATYKICEKNELVCKLIIVDEAQHDLFMEQDIYRNQLLLEVNKFLSQQKEEVLWPSSSL